MGVMHLGYVTRYLLRYSGTYMLPVSQCTHDDANYAGNVKKDTARPRNMKRAMKSKKRGYSMINVIGIIYRARLLIFCYYDRYILLNYYPEFILYSFDANTINMSCNY